MQRLLQALNAGEHSQSVVDCLATSVRANRDSDQNQSVQLSVDDSRAVQNQFEHQTHVMSSITLSVPELRSIGAKGHRRATATLLSVGATAAAGAAAAGAAAAVSCSQRRRRSCHCCCCCHQLVCLCPSVPLLSSSCSPSMPSSACQLMPCLALRWVSAVIMGE